MQNHHAASDSPAAPHKEELRVVRNRSTYERRLKRPLDLVSAVVGLVVVSPLLALISGAIVAGLGRPILYSQERVGENGELFTIYKFRTMRPDRRNRDSDAPAEGDRRAQHKHDNDPRHTGLGRILRKISLDELPQLINVIRGDMSLVGPRPEIADVAHERGYFHHVRHEVKPGMTGPYQVSMLRYNGDLRDGLHLDEQYVSELTFRNDLSYLVRTATMFFRESSGK